MGPRLPDQQDLPQRCADPFLINKISRSGAPILRKITTASVVFENGVMWASLGQPDKNPYKAYKLSDFPK